MRFDTTLYCHIGEPCDRGLLFDEMHETILAGTPDTVAARVERLRDGLGCRHLALFPNIPLLSFRQVKRSLRLFAEEVIPRFAVPAPRRAPGPDAAGAERRA